VCPCVKVGIRLGGKESKISVVWERDALGVYLVEKCVWIELCKEKFLDSCSSLNVTGMISSKRTKRALY